MSSVGLLQKETTALLVIDVQDRLIPVIHNGQALMKEVNTLLTGAQILDLPIIITEQYPKGLGSTCLEIEMPASCTIIEKMTFSCMLSAPVREFLKERGIKSLIIAGVEAHICVLKTVLDALKDGYEVHVVADAVSSRTAQNKQIALERMRQSGAFIVSTELVLFQLLDIAGTIDFKAISRLIK